MNRWHVAPVEASQAEAVRQLFETVFGHSMSQALWEWKYGSGRGHGVGAWDEAGRLVGHYGAMKRRAWFDGRIVDVVQIGDVMVDRSAHRTLLRRGVAFQTAFHFASRWVGYDKPYLLGYGFPSHVHYRLFEKLDLYRSVGRVFELRKHLSAPEPASRTWRIEPVENLYPGIESSLEQLWRVMLGELADHILIERHPGYLRQRFFRHPEHRYRMFVLRRRWSRHYQAAFILRQLPEDPGRCELLDWLAVPEMLDPVIRHAAVTAAQWGAHQLFCWGSDAVCRWLLPLMDEAVDIQVTIPTSVVNPGPAPETLQGRWWLTGGDTDFH